MPDLGDGNEAIFIYRNALLLDLVPSTYQRRERF